MKVSNLLHKKIRKKENSLVNSSEWAHHFKISIKITNTVQLNQKCWSI